MQRTTIKKAILALVFASALPLAACGDDDDITTPTSPGPTVTDTTPTATTPTPTPTPTPAPTPTPTPAPPQDDRPVVSITGPVVNLVRSGEGNMDVSFRIDDFTIVRVANGTPVISGSRTFDTSAIVSGQTVMVEGRRTNGFLDATRVELISPAP